MTKRSILLVALALLAVSQVAANEYMYTPFVREGVKWVYYYVNEDGFYPADTILGKGKVYMNLEFKGDTVINGLTYKAMHKYNGEYYLSYSTGTTHRVVYATGKSLLG